MSRFSIRIQIFCLTGVFLLGLIATSAFGWFTQRGLGVVIHHTSSLSDESAALTLMMEDVDESVSNMLFIAVDPDFEWEVFTGGIESILSQIEAAQPLFTVPTPQHAEITAGLSEITATLNEIVPLFDAVHKELAQGKLDLARSEVLPRLGKAEERLGGLMADLSATTVASQADAAARVEQSNRMAIAMSVAVVFVALTLSFFFGRQLSNPVTRAKDRIAGLARQDYTSAIDDQDRGDEVGAIARSLEALRCTLSDAAQAEERVKLENGRRVDLFHTLSAAMSQLRGGHLAAQIEAQDWSDLGESYVKLCRDFNELAGTLEQLVASLRASTSTVQSSATELSGMADDMSRRAEMQAATLEQSAAALDVLSVGVKTAADKAEEADLKVIEGREKAEQGGQVMARALEAMSSIAKSSEQISQIIGVIDDIAFQTNLLALNAGVEAARAGESGKGFSVVASEVRQLAQRASSSANEIKELVLNSVTQVEDGERLVQATSETLTHIVESVTEVSSMVSGIAALSREQAGGVEEINVGIAELDKVTQQNAAMVGQTSVASQQLSVEATRLSDLLTRFTGGGAQAGGTGGGSAQPRLQDHPDDIDLFNDTAGEKPRVARKQPATSRAAAGKDRGGSRPGARQATARDDDLEAIEVLKHGNWAKEYGDPEPIPVSIPETLAVNAAPSSSARPRTSNDDAWADF